MEDNIDKVEAKNTKELYMIASQFCTFMEHIHTFEQYQIIDYLLKITPLMYLKGSLMPEIEMEDVVAPCEQFVTEEQYELLYLKLKEKLTEIEFFEWYSWAENEMKTCSICEMLSDIYQDMKNFILSYNKNTLTTQENALFIHKKNFIDIWGRHITVLLPYLHHLACPVEEEID
ncbi:MAG: DUF5063 domain-containing protein [Bacteroidales bacterium]|jgi:hypothetical protein|nr:DUF5063 domain-containing protein [Bacteroidales bacterium]